MRKCRTAIAACILLMTAAGLAAQPPRLDVDISGQYSFLHEGEYVQIAVQGEKVTGFVSRLGETEFDRDVHLDHSIVNGTLRGRQMSFGTTELHAIWFEFSGQVQRGPAKNRAEEGFYVLQGILKRHTSDAERRERVESREVTFKLQAE